MQESDGFGRAEFQPETTAPPAGAGVHESLSDARPLFGREADLAALATLCADQQVVTVLGAGGVGKTRVAQAFARRYAQRFPDGCIRVDLARVAESASVPLVLASALGFTLVPGIDPLESMLLHVRLRKLLIIVDHAEHLFEALCRVLRKLLAAGPALRVLVPGRQPMRVALEHVYRLAPLSVPSLPCAVVVAKTHGAVALFCACAEADDPHFALTADNLPDIVRVCGRLDGIARALELAAAHLPLLGAAGLARHLDEHGELTGERHPSRQHTLRAVLEWSHALLAPDEQRVLRRVAVAVGGFDLALACRLAGDAGADADEVRAVLAALVRHRWVDFDPAPVPRYSLAEPARGYALLTLHEAGEFGPIRSRHGAAIEQLFERAYDDFWTLGDETYLARYRPELDNLRAALNWAREAEPPSYIALVAAATPLLRQLARIREAVDCLGVAEGLVTPASPLATRARLALGVAMMGGGRSAARQAVELYRQLGSDARGLCIAVHQYVTRNDVPAELAEEMAHLVRRVDDSAWPARVRSLAQGIEEARLARRGQHDEVLQSVERRIALCEGAGAHSATVAALADRMRATFAVGDARGALEQGLRSTARCRALGDDDRLAEVEAMTIAALLLVDEDRRAEADRLARTFADLDRSLGWPHRHAAFDALALLAARDGRIEHAALLVGFADEIHFRGEMTRGPFSAAARAGCMALIDAALDPARRTALAEEGRSLSPEDAGRLALPEWPVRVAQ